MKVLECKSTGEFITHISTVGKGWWRGESKDYGSTKLTASLFRKNEKGNHNTIKTVRAFYESTFSMLTKNEQDHFLAFAQHHKIPTPLLDISENSLVALWLACSKHFETDGYVYGFISKGFADVSEYVDMIKPWDNGEVITEDAKVAFGKSVLYALRSSAQSRGEKPLESDELRTFFLRFIELQSRYYTYNDYDSMRKWSEQLSRLIYGTSTHRADIISVIRDINGNRTKLLNGKYDDIDMYKVITDAEASEIFAKLKMTYFDTFGYEQQSNTLFKLVYELAALGDFDKLPLLIYRPLLSFNRAVDQKGLFIYQARHYPNVNDHGNVKLQRISADISVKVCSSDKKKILNELRAINIHRATVYRDYDNIATDILETSDT